MTDSALSPMRQPRSWLFPAMGAIGVAAVAIGFGRTYFYPMSRGAFIAPAVVHVHGALAMSWVLLFLTQPLLVRLGQLRVHRKVGLVGSPLAAAVALTMIPAGMFQATRDHAAGGGATAISALLGVVTSGALFVALVTLGIVRRRDREAHARWMLLATLVVLWPAWFRFRHWFPPIERPDILFGLVLADLWILVAMVHDRVVRGAVHPVLLWGGLVVMAEQTFEVFVFDSPWWRVAAQALYDGFRALGM